MDSSLLSILLKNVPEDLLEDYQKKREFRRVKKLLETTMEQIYDLTEHQECFYYAEGGELRTTPPIINVQFPHEVVIELVRGEDGVHSGIKIVYEIHGQKISERVIKGEDLDLEEETLTFHPPEETEDGEVTLRVDYRGVFILVMKFQTNGKRNEFIRRYLHLRALLTSTEGNVSE